VARLCGRTISSAPLNVLEDERLLCRYLTDHPDDFALYVMLERELNWTEYRSDARSVLEVSYWAHKIWLEALLHNQLKATLSSSEFPVRIMDDLIKQKAAQHQAMKQAETTAAAELVCFDCRIKQVSETLPPPVDLVQELLERRPRFDRNVLDEELFEAVDCFVLQPQSSVK